jgi:sensor histidine kinase YesM
MFYFAGTAFLKRTFIMDRLNDKWYRIIGIPLVALMANIIFYYDMNEKHGFTFLTDYIYTLVIAFLLWEANRQVIIYTRRKYSLFKDSAKRITWTAMGCVVVTVLIMTSISAFYDLTNWWGYPYKLKNYLYNNFAALTYCILIDGIYEGTYYFRKWRSSEVEAEKLKKENLQSQLESLKRQVSPHFLFNSLNTLSSLMRKDVDRAELFLDELSKVYRYLLRNNEDMLIDLETELEFIGSYFHLLRTRFGEAVQLVVNVDEAGKCSMLPPLTLQLLIENAVKHNIIEKSMPLIIEIKTAGKTLTVKNNLQRKTLKLPSNNVGLSNIAAKYKLLDAHEIEIMETEKEFAVRIPLLKNMSNENSNR